MNAIEMTALRKSFPKSSFTLDLPELTVQEGYVTGFIGENGAGKTTTLRLIMDMLFADQGEIKVFGLDSRRDGVAIRQQIGYVGEQPGFMELARLEQLARMISPFYSDWDDDAYQKYLRRFDLDPKKTFKSLSKGKQKQFALAMALSRHPRLLLMDEPTANLDPLVRQEILDILMDELEQSGVTIFFSTHITSDLDKIADYIHFLHGGRLIISQEKDRLVETHRIVKARTELLTTEVRSAMVDVHRSEFGFTGLCADTQRVYGLLGDEAVYEKPTTEDIFLAYTRRERGREQ